MMSTPFLSARSFYSILNAEGAQGVDTQRLRAISAQKGAGDVEKQRVENPRKMKKKCEKPNFSLATAFKML
ncbi:MAG: hypothetical protein ACI4OX_05965, partial [Akkermansia sp.]